jgi:hypothetical protein
MEYKIGHVEMKLSLDGKQKFIVYKEGNDLVYHAVRMGSGDSPKHKQIAEEIGKHEVTLGGGNAGMYLISGGIYGQRPGLWGKSHTYGGVPREIVENFRLLILPLYRQLIPNLEDTDFTVRTECDTSLENWIDGFNRCKSGVTDRNWWST